MAQADLAGLLDRLSRPAEARKLFESGRSPRSGAILGPHHVDLAETLFSYGLLLIGRQELKAADAALTRGPEHLWDRTATRPRYCLRYLGLSAMDQERYQDAAGLFTRAADTFARTLGANDAERWRAVANLGWAHLKLKQVPQARRELTEAVAKIEQLAGPESYELRLPLKELGETLTAAGATAEAIATLERVHRLEGSSSAPSSTTRWPARTSCSPRRYLARGAAGDRPAARRSLDEAMGIFTRRAAKDLLYGKVLLDSGTARPRRGGPRPRPPGGWRRRSRSSSRHVGAHRTRRSREARRLLKTGVEKQQGT